MPELKIYLDEKAPPVVPGVLTFETGAAPDQVIDPLLWAYEHHGAGFGQALPGALTCLFEDLSMGRPMPTAFLTRQVRDVDTLVAATLFRHRDLLFLPRTVGFVAEIDLVHRRGHQFVGHLEPEVGRFVRLLRGYFPDNLSPGQVNSRLPTAIEWVRSYLVEGRFPSLGAVFPTPTVLDARADGFVVAESTGSLPEAWFEAFRMGFYQGVMFGPRNGTLLPVLAARKSSFVPLDLDRAVMLLNDVEVSLGGAPRWSIAGDWLWGPPDGTLMLATDVVRTVLSVGIPLFKDQ